MIFIGSLAADTIGFGRTVRQPAVVDPCICRSMSSTGKHHHASDYQNCRTFHFSPRFVIINSSYNCIVDNIVALCIKSKHQMHIARDSFNDQSDIDIVVKLENPDLLNLIGIKQELEERFRCTVDVVRYRDKMNRFLKRRIDQEAVYA